MGNEKKIKSTNKTNIEANVLNRLISHLQSRTDVQNIDLMNLSGFCRNCLSKWYVEEAAKLGIEGVSNYVRISELKKQAVNKLIDNVDHSQVLDYL